MEVHTHTHTERKKFTHYLWEFLMLFLAVTLGFFVENQREHYIERKRAAEYVQQLLFDLTKDTTRLNNDISYYKWRENTIDSLIVLLQQKENTYPAIQFYPKLRSMDTWRVPVGFSNTYDDLKTAGLLRYFTHHHIADKLKAYYQPYVVFFFYEDELAQYVKEVCEPFLDNHFEGIYYVTESSGPNFSQVIYPVPEDKKVVIPDPVKKEMLNILVRMRFKKIGVATISDFCIQKKEEAIKLITILKEQYKL